MQPANNFIFVLGGFLALFAVFLIYAVNRTYRTRARFLDLLSGIGTPGAGPERVIEYSGHRISTGYFEGTRSRPSSFSLTARVSAPASFSLKAQSAADTFMEKLGLESDVETQDAAFDSRFHIVSDDMDFAKAYFASAKKREAVAALFAEGCTAVELDGDGLRAEWSPFPINGATGVDFVGRSLEPLAALAGEFPAFVPAPAAGGFGRKDFDRFASWAFGLLVLAYFVLPMIAGRLQPLDWWRLLLYSLHYTGPAFLIVVFALFTTLKGKSWFFTGIMKGAGFCLLFFPLSGYWCAVCVNAELDKSEPVVHTVPVIYKSVSRTRNSTTYSVYVQSWRTGNGGERLSVSRAEYGSVEPRRNTAVIATKPGYLGFEFVTSYQFQSAVRIVPIGASALNPAFR